MYYIMYVCIIELTFYVNHKMISKNYFAICIDIYFLPDSIDL